MAQLFKRHPENPIVQPGGLPWRRAVTFNPAVLLDDDGRYYLWERTAGGLTPFHCHIGLMASDDGVHFTHVREEPVLTPAMLGSKYGSVQDPRVVKIDGRYLLTYAYRPYAWSSYPTGVGVPRSEEVHYPGFDGDSRQNQTRSGVAVSTDRVTWEHLGWVNPPEVDDRNVILFPERIHGEYWALRRPSGFVSTQAQHDREPGIYVSRSKDLKSWTDPVDLLRPALGWENNRIGGSTPPIRTEAGWLVFYHGVETRDPERRTVIYRVGAAMLDADDPMRVIARCTEPVMEPTAYYERFGTYIPNVVFPTAAVVDPERTIRLYYGCCDTAIALATAKLDDVVAHVMRDRT